MDEKITLLILGSLIGLLSSLVTRLFDEWLIVRRQQRDHEKERREKDLEEIHRLMIDNRYREIGPSTGRKRMPWYGSLIGLLLGFVALAFIIKFDLSGISPIMVISVILLMLLGWIIGRLVLRSLWKAKR
jgi:hypothetical protein